MVCIEFVLYVYWEYSDYIVRLQGTARAFVGAFSNLLFYDLIVLPYIFLSRRVSSELVIKCFKLTWLAAKCECNCYGESVVYEKRRDILCMSPAISPISRLHFCWKRLVQRAREIEEQRHTIYLARLPTFFYLKYTQSITNQLSKTPYATFCLFRLQLISNKKLDYFAFLFIYPIVLHKCIGGHITTI